MYIIQITLSIFNDKTSTIWVDTEVKAVMSPNTHIEIGDTNQPIHRSSSSERAHRKRRLKKSASRESRTPKEVSTGTTLATSTGTTPATSTGTTPATSTGTTPATSTGTTPATSTGTTPATSTGTTPATSTGTTPATSTGTTPATSTEVTIPTATPASSSMAPIQDLSSQVDYWRQQAQALLQQQSTTSAKWILPARSCKTVLCMGYVDVHSGSP
uniref:Uncharacterized protein n=1 Tax=Strigamia maritima TaxID=126957 RepID=T1IL55_STRMM